MRRPKYRRAASRSPKWFSGRRRLVAAVATLVAFLVGYAAIAWLLRYLAHHSVNLFVVYRVLLGSTVLILVATGLIS